MLTFKKSGEINSLVQSQQKIFRQFDEPVSSFSDSIFRNSKFADLLNLKKANDAANLPAAAFNFNQPQHPYFQNYYPNAQPQPFFYQANTAQSYTTPQNHWPFQMPLSPHLSPPVSLHAPQNKFYNSLLATHPKVTLWDEFKRIYITEVLAFTMSKSTLFTLIFSFMFLGCIFFLSGFFTATNIYREQHSVSNVSKQHVPSETAMLQGRPERVVNMGAGIAHNAPKAYQYQGGVKVNQNVRRPSQYVEQQINSKQPYYR